MILASVEQTPPAAETAPAIPDDVLAKLRAAAGRVDVELVARGSAEVAGQTASFTLRLAADGRSDWQVKAAAGYRIVDGGACAWSLDSAGPVRVLELEELDLARLWIALLGGRWLERGAPFRVTPDAARSTGERLVFDVEISGGVRRGELEVDGASFHPLSFTIGSRVGEQRWTFSDWTAFEGRAFPRAFERRDGTATESFRVTALEPAPADARAFAEPAAPALGTRWVEGAAALVRLKRAPSGHLVFHPRLEGEDLGAFVLDSGAAVTILRRDIADELGMERFGSLRLGGVGQSSIASAFRRGAALDLGPLVLSDLVYFEGVVPGLAEAVGEPIAGILGYDLFARAIVELDSDAPSIALHEPAHYARPELDWQPLSLYGRHPHVEAGFEQRERGLFRFDTGMGGLALLLHAPTVERLHLLAGRETREIEIGGAGGATNARLGKVASFELGKWSLAEPTTVFAESTGDAGDDPYSLGTFGPPLLKGLVAVFDYPGRRVAFFEHERR